MNANIIIVIQYAENWDSVPVMSSFWLSKDVSNQPRIANVHLSIMLCIYDTYNTFSSHDAVHLNKVQGRNQIPQGAKECVLLIIYNSMEKICISHKPIV